MQPQGDVTVFSSFIIIFNCIQQRLIAVVNICNIQWQKCLINLM